MALQQFNVIQPFQQRQLLRAEQRAGTIGDPKQACMPHTIAYHRNAREGSGMAVDATLWHACFQSLKNGGWCTCFEWTHQELRKPDVDVRHLS
jgi:hypothetical protein